MRKFVFAALIVAVAAMARVQAQAPTPAPAPAAPATPAPAPPAAPARAGAQARTAVQAAPVTPPTPVTATMPPAVVAAAQGVRFPNPPRNVRFDIVISEAGVAKPTTKTISLTVNDSNGSGSVRNNSKPGVSLNVDVRAVQAFEGGSVRAAINVEYQPDFPDASAPSSGIQSSITSMFQDGRRTQILQTADPLSDRRTTIEVTMTVLK